MKGIVNTLVLAAAVFGSGVTGAAESARKDLCEVLFSGHKEAIRECKKKSKGRTIKTSSNTSRAVSTSSYTSQTGAIKQISDIEVDGLSVSVYRRESSLCESGHLDSIHLDGPIGPDSTFVVGKMLERIDSCLSSEGNVLPTNVYLDSQGGLLKDGYALGKMFREAGVSTNIRRGATCASSCAVAFLGGESRQLSDGGTIMFHAPYVLTGKSVYDPYSKKTLPEIDCRTGESDTLGTYYARMLGPEAGARILDRTLSRCSTNDGWQISQAEAALLYEISTAVIPPFLTEAKSGRLSS